jgi:hypothetical protein
MRTEGYYREILLSVGRNDNQWKAEGGELSAHILPRNQLHNTITRKWGARMGSRSLETRGECPIYPYSVFELLTKHTLWSWFPDKDELRAHRLPGPNLSSLHPNLPYSAQ